MRIAEAAEAEVDHPGPVVDRPADRLRLCDRRDSAVGADDLRDQQLGGEGDAGDPLPVAERRGDDPGDERAVALAVRDLAADEALRERHPAGELRMLDVEAGVDYSNPHGTQRGRKVDPVVECMDRAEVPLLGRQRVVGDERS